MNECVQMLRLPDVMKRTALSRSQIYRLIGLGTFPRQIQLGERSSAWIEQEIEGWLVERIERSRKCGASQAVEA